MNADHHYVLQYQSHPYIQWYAYIPAHQVPYSHDMCPCPECFPNGLPCHGTCRPDTVSCPLYRLSLLLLNACVIVVIVVVIVIVVIVVIAIVVQKILTLILGRGPCLALFDMPNSN